jgi:hypothetical protein
VILGWNREELPRNTTVGVAEEKLEDAGDDEE